MKVFEVTYGWHGENEPSKPVLVAADSEDEAVAKFIAHCHERALPLGVAEGHYQSAWELRVIQ